MFKLMGTEINAILDAQTTLIWTYDLAFDLCSADRICLVTADHSPADF